MSDRDRVPGKIPPQPVNRLIELRFPFVDVDFYFQDRRGFGDGGRSGCEPVEYMEGKDNNTNELFIPDDQRPLVWDEVLQSKFIESVFLGWPMLHICLADVYDSKNDLYSLEIIDGGQRIRTLANFISNELTLTELEKLDKLNGFTFADLPLTRQRRFQKNTIRTVILTKNTDEEMRRDLFEKIHTLGI